MLNAVAAREGGLDLAPPLARTDVLKIVPDGKVQPRLDRHEAGAQTSRRWREYEMKTQDLHFVGLFFVHYLVVTSVV